MATDKITSASIADGAVSADALTSTAITGQTAETTIADDDLILISDTSASAALKKMTKANFVSGVGGVSTPYFIASISSGQTVSDNAVTKATFQEEIIDSDGCYDNSTNYRFTPTTAGKYFVAATLAGTTFGVDAINSMEIYIYKNGSAYMKCVHNAATSYQYWLSPVVNAIVDMNGSSDYLEVYGKLDVVANTPQFYSARHSWFMAHKLIG